MEDAMEAMEDVAGQQVTPGDDTPSVEPEKPMVEPEKPTEEPRKTEPVKEPEKTETEDALLPKEDMQAIFATFAPEEPELEPQPKYQVPPSSSQQPPAQPQMPQDILEVTSQKFMPQGQEFDPMDAHIPGTPSHIAAMHAEEERFNIRAGRERERMRQEEIARRGSEQIARLNTRMEREKWPPAMRQKFWNRITNEGLNLDLVADSFILGERKALRKAQTARVAGGNGGEPPPVSKVSRIVEKPSTPDAIDKEVVELFGPRRELAI